VEIEKSEDAMLTTAAALRTKVAVVWFIFAPKIAIAVYLWWLGARWLTSTTNFQDLLLNAVALAFITELDELMYKVIVPEDIQALVGMYKIARSGYGCKPDIVAEHFHETCSTMLEESDRAARRRIARILVTMAVVTALPILYMRYLQNVLPGYRWDVHAPCESRVAEFLDLEA